MTSDIQNAFPISSEVVGLGKVLQGKYKIPDYQRPYEWKEKNIDDFLSSIFDGFTTDTEENSKRKPVFFGTIQLNKNNKNELDIVDGQQRLTTFLLFLHTIKMNCYEGRDYSTIIESDKLKEALSNKENSEDQSDNTYSENKKLLKDKIENYYNKYETKYKNEKLKFYSDLKDYILEKVYFVKLNTEDMELSDVVSVFNTINTTGLDLNASDIFKFRYYDYLNKNYNNDNWMKEIDKCYKFIDINNEERKDYQKSLDMNLVLDIFKHIICAQNEWGFDEVSKSNQKFFNDLFKEKCKELKDKKVLEFDSFYNIVENFVKYWRWIEETIHNNEPSTDAKELFSIDLIYKSRYCRYWTIPFVVAYFKANRKVWSNYYIDSLKVNLWMFKFFMIYSVINDKVINAVQNQVCKNCFRWFKNCKTEEIIENIKGLMWSAIRWPNDNPNKVFYETIKSGLADNGSRVHLVCTLTALLDEINHLNEKIGETDISKRTIKERLFNWEKNPYDIEHIIAQNIFKDFDETKKTILNGIGNLVVLNRKINRDIKDNQVKEKVKEYDKSKYAAVVLEFLKNYKCEEWDTEDISIKAVERRRDKEIEKIKKFMEA